MRRLSASDVVLKALGLLLLTAAVLKGHELLTVPTADKDLWSWRPFLIFQGGIRVGLGHLAALGPVQAPIRVCSRPSAVTLHKRSTRCSIFLWPFPTQRTTIKTSETSTRHHNMR